MRKALIVGIDHYDHICSLSGCVNDAHSVKSLLERHADGTVNFVTPKILTGTSSTNRVDKVNLKDAVRELFSGDSEIAVIVWYGMSPVSDPVWDVRSGLMMSHVSPRSRDRIRYCMPW